MSILASSSFTGSDESPLSESGAWATPSSLNGLRRVSNAVATVTASVDSAARHVGITWPNNHYSKWRVAVVADGDGGPACRMNGVNSCYFVTNYDATNIKLYRLTAGSFDFLTEAAAVYATNDTIQIEAEGSVVRVKRNAVTIITYDDVSGSALATGNAGLFMYNGTLRFDDFEGGDFSAADTLMGQVCT